MIGWAGWFCTISFVHKACILGIADVDVTSKFSCNQNIALFII